MKSLNVLKPLAIILILVVPACATEPPSEVAETHTIGSAAGTHAVGSNEKSVVKLGKISPNGPYRIWSAVNKVLLDYASLKGGEELKSQVKDLNAGRFYGKTPTDVLIQAAEFRDALERILDRLQLPKVEIYEDPLGRQVTPGVVFVNAGHIMDAVVSVVHSASDHHDEPLGALYDVPVATGKTPSDVFGLVYLATRRLQLIAAS